MKYQGSCHCGAVRFSFDGDEITRGLRCNCSICVRKGAVMTPYTISPEKIKITSGKEMLSAYQFDSQIAKHYFCSNCGIYPFHETARVKGHFRANIGCLDGVDAFSIPFDVFDGKNWNP